MSLYKDSSLAMIPTAYKDGKLYSVRPTDGSGDFTFSRGSNLAATRVASSGYIEKGRENVLLQSNQFDTTWASVFTANVVGGQSGYDGSSDAWTLETQSGQASRIVQSLSGLQSVNTLSVYAKANTLDWIRLQISTASGNYVSDFDLTNGVSGFTFGSPLPNIESVGGGWYRVSIVGFAPPTEVRIYAASGDNNLGGAGTIFIQDAQLEQGLVATDYIETGTSAAQSGILEDMPRLDYSGSCPSLLLEPSRTNLITQSEYIGSWGTLNASVTDNATTSPEGVSNAAALVDDATNASHYVQSSVITHATGQDMMASVFLKKGTRTQARLRLSGGTGSAYFNLEDGSVVSESGATATIEDYGNGWYRCAIFDDSAQFGTGRLQVMSAVNGNSSYIGDSTEAIYIYGAQYEHNVSYPTSYIPTYGSSVTRSKDFVYLTSASDLMNINGTTFLLEVQGISNGGNSRRFSISDGTYNNRVVIELDETADTIKVFLVGNGVVGASLTITSIDQTNNNKIAVAFDNSGVIVYINGEYKTQDTSITLPTALTDIKFRVSGGSNLEMEGYVKQTIVFPSRLTNTELAALTTL